MTNLQKAAQILEWDPTLEEIRTYGPILAKGQELVFHGSKGGSVTVKYDGSVITSGPKNGVFWPGAAALKRIESVKDRAPRGSRPVVLAKNGHWGFGPGEEPRD